MRRAAILVGVGLLALCVQGVTARYLPPPYCPDLGLLVVVALGLVWERATTGLLASFSLGIAADVLSGSLLGQHALLRTIAFATARLASRQLNLRGPLPLSVFVAGLSVAYAAAVLASTHFFAGPARLDAAFSVDTLQHALVNAIFAGWIAQGVQWVAARTGEDEGARRSLRLDAGQRPA